MLDYLPLLLQGAWVTIQITAGAAVLGLVCAFAAGLAAVSGHRVLRGVAIVYVEFFRGTSALVQLFWLFFALPLVGIRFEPIAAGIVALGLNIGSYGSEVVRGAIRAIPKGQYEATVALNMTPYRRMRSVILPQAVVGMLPPFGNLLIELLKGTSLVSIISIADLTFNAQVLRSAALPTLQVFLVVLVLYFVMAYTLTLGMKVLERRAAASIGQGRVPDLPETVKLAEPV
ncbi:MAG: ectoine/hydroxyectoine ABC transporter permease subunit EhuC [Actinomycetota bacterium]|nr:ectoine/hydroxyectoine ABC transporter permease subunit EhuC [Actinomycetota bacterium]